MVQIGTHLLALVVSLGGTRGRNEETRTEKSNEETGNEEIGNKGAPMTRTTSLTHMYCNSCYMRNLIDIVMPEC